MTNNQITMGAGLLPPQHAVVTADAPTPARSRRVPALLAGAAVFSPALFTACVALDPAPLPREPAADFLPAIAENTTAYLTATTFQMGSMICGIALVALVALTFGRSSPRLAGLTTVLLTLGYLGGMGFVGAKFVAADLTVDGRVRPGAEEIWTAVHSGPIFEILSWPLVMVIPGTLLLAVLLLRARARMGWWPGALILVGFVASSGEFPDWVTITGWALQIPAVAAIAWHFLREVREPTPVS